ncbi:putative 2-acylglycerol O-acyltransferase [Helianthus annuus]|nr:putative 2-acylglycerol O-acyltransferase [Helianthus annuus]KAJ0872293.1 putative 2-acylglycerol O-acyltransferase [Helianthus annuus]
MLTRVEDVIPRWKIVPTKDVIDVAFKDPIRANTLIYQEKPRLKTALEMLRASMGLEDSLSKVTLPFFVLRGEADTVTDPEVSRALYEQASSEDKTIKLYPGMWHGLTSGEPDHNIDIVFGDIISWLDKRSEDDYIPEKQFSDNVGGIEVVSPVVEMSERKPRGVKLMAAIFVGGRDGGCSTTPPCSQHYS